MKAKNIIIALLLILIIYVGFIIRIYKLSSIPAGFFADEAAIGYNAHKLLTTSRDEYGVFLPFFFRSFGDYRLPIPIYSNVPFVALFGLNEFSVRLTAVVFGSLTILVIFFLTQKLLNNNLIALFASLFVAISPWHIHFSRFGSEYIYFPFWFSLGLYLFLLGLKRGKILFISFFVFGISLYTYYPALFIVPIFIFFIILIYFKQLIRNKKNTAIGLLIFFLMTIPFFIGVQNGSVLTRWQKVSVINEQNNQSIAPKILNSYIAHFTPAFLFEKGDIDYPGHFISRFSVRGMGELYLFQLPLLLFGILYFIKQKKHLKILLVLLTWLALYPLGSSVTGTDGGGPFAFRSIFGVIPFQIISATGIVFLLSIFKNKIAKYFLVIILAMAIILSFKNYLHRYFVEYPLYSSDFWGWQYGPRDVMKYFIKVNSQYDDLFLMGSFNSPEIFISFYDPQNRCQGKCQIGGLEKINPNRKQLFAIGFDRMKEIQPLYSFKTYYNINYPNGNTAFIVGELKQN